MVVPGSFWEAYVYICVYIYMYIYIYMCTYIYMYIHIHISGTLADRVGLFVGEWSPIRLPCHPPKE